MNPCGCGLRVLGGNCCLLQAVVAQRVCWHRVEWLLRDCSLAVTTWWICAQLESWVQCSSTCRLPACTRGVLLAMTAAAIWCTACTGGCTHVAAVQELALLHVSGGADYNTVFMHAPRRCLIVPPCRFSIGITLLNLENTNLTGPLPGISRSQFKAGAVPLEHVCSTNASGFGRLPSLELASISGTKMTAACAGRGRSPQPSDAEVCYNIDNALPWHVGKWLLHSLASWVLLDDSKNSHSVNRSTTCSSVFCVSSI